jgi:hypothetical protein
MLTLDLLRAVLHGLPPVHLTHLQRPWQRFCSHIHHHLRMGHPPLEALKLALDGATDDELALLTQAVSEIRGVMRLSDLSFRQKQALAALRVERVATLAFLSRTLNWDRSHTYHRLAALVKKGYALKFYGDHGATYFAIDTPQDRSVAYDAFQIILDHIIKLMQDRERSLQQYLEKHNIPATLATSATSATPATNAMVELATEAMQTKPP